MGFVFRLFTVVCFAAAVVPSSIGGVIFNTNATWRVFKGTQEASTPTTAWRAINFDDRSWPELRSSFFYGEALDGTVLADMQGNYTSLFLRRSFVLTDASQVTELTLTSF
ncbi:MAG: hypothetical protein FJ405_19105, partial [Verrucomicrobia bacterium]|nr:hypothetical protein [Verrucomicrobiota bacterium]